MKSTVALVGLQMIFFHKDEIENKLVVLKLYARMSGKIVKIRLNVKRNNFETEQIFRVKI